MEITSDILVAQIERPERIVINKGSLNGIKEHMRFLVYEEGEEIFDPITKESLGILEKPKGRYKVYNLQERLTILSCEKTQNNQLVFAVNPSYEIAEERRLLKSIVVGDKVKLIK